LFQHPNVRFVNVNVAEFDAYKASAIPVVADARVALEELAAALTGHHVESEYASRITALRREWDIEVDRLFHLNGAPPAQSEIIGALTTAAAPRDVMVSAAGGHPADLHKLWQTRTPNSFHLEYGYSCMGYEIPAGIGVKLADPSREVYVIVGDGTYLLNPTELLTAIQENVKITIVVLDNRGFGCINGLSKAVGCGGFGTRFRERSTASGQLDGDFMQVDFVANARSLGADAVQVRTIPELAAAVEASKSNPRVNVIVIETTTVNAPSYDAWWDCAVAEVSAIDDVERARKTYEERLKKERDYLSGAGTSNTSTAKITKSSC
jgi:3D-(3,5/4)-trihydroxycyclohexane-1,2-dione acylhydrolase (decyclizing)